jgi:hypothetical protein
MKSLTYVLFISLLLSLGGALTATVIKNLIQHQQKAQMTTASPTATPTASPTLIVTTTPTPGITVIPTPIITGKPSIQRNRIHNNEDND